jgi:hypothetical protein
MLEILSGKCCICVCLSLEGCVNSLEWEVEEEWLGDVVVADDGHGPLSQQVSRIAPAGINGTVSSDFLYYSLCSLILKHYFLTA